MLPSPVWNRALNPVKEPMNAGLIRCGWNFTGLSMIILTIKRLRTSFGGIHALLRIRKRRGVKGKKGLFGRIGHNVSVGQPFICDYGCNIDIGDNVSVNMNCTFVDCNKIEIGSNVLIASNVQLYTATHPVELAQRLTLEWNFESGEYFCRTYALPIKIGDGFWLGGGVIALPGVSIGKGSVIGTGSVVTKDIPDNLLAVGNPCRVVRKINGK